MMRTKNKRQQTGFVMLTAIMVLLLVAWPVQQIMGKTQFLLQQQAFQEAQLQAYISAHPLAVSP